MFLMLISLFIIYFLSFSSFPFAFCPADMYIYLLFARGFRHSQLRFLNPFSYFCGSFLYNFSEGVVIPHPLEHPHPPSLSTPLSIGLILVPITLIINMKSRRNLFARLQFFPRNINTGRRQFAYKCRSSKIINTSDPYDAVSHMGCIIEYD